MYGGYSVLRPLDFKSKFRRHPCKINSISFMIHQHSFGAYGWKCILSVRLVVNLNSMNEWMFALRTITKQLSLFGICLLSVPLSTAQTSSNSGKLINCWISLWRILQSKQKKMRNIFFDNHKKCVIIGGEIIDRKKPWKSPSIFTCIKTKFNYVVIFQ